MKNIEKTISFILIIAFILFLNGCGKKKISFEVNGGNSISSVEVKEKEEYTLPIPTRDGFEFGGWYLTSDFSGDSVLSVTVTDDVKVYAKWEQLYKINLDANGGTLSTVVVYGKSGDNIADLIKNYIPSKTDAVFGAWYNENNELNNSSKITDKDINLVAKYKTKYTINVYKENLNHDGYDKETITQYEYSGKTVSYSLDEDGLIEVTKEDSQNEINISDDSSKNILNVYYDRELFTVTFRSNYPDSKKTEETLTLNLYYGEEIELPTVDFNIEGYYLLGFSLSPTSELLYNSHFIENLVINNEDEIVFTKDKVSTNRTCSLYAVWNKGYVDMFGGSDYVFISNDNETAYLDRSGIYFVGEYYDSDKSFIFYNDKENLEGRIYDDGTYAYYNASRDEYSAVLYTVGGGLDEDIKILFDPYNGVTYYDGKLEEADKRESKGTYTLDENNFYHITFTEGLKAGETMVVTVGNVSSGYVTTEAFQYRKDSEYDMGSIVRFAVSNSQITYYPYAYQIELSGFGTLTYNNGTSLDTYYYSYDEETKLLKISNANSNLGTFKIMTNNGMIGYMSYDETADKTYNGDNESTLVLDGVCNATYTFGATSVSGVYSIKQSVFGGYIVSFRYEGKEYTFRTSSKTVENVITGEGQDSTTETVTTYSFITKPNGYDEFYYKDDKSLYYAPLIVLNDLEENKASVYGYTPKGTFELVLEGTYILDENTNLYIFTTQKTHNKKVLTSPIDLKTITSFVFNIDTESTGYSINYWYSKTTESETIDYKKEYKNTDNSSIILVNGIAILSKDGDVITGTYNTNGTITTISNQYGNVYVELKEDNTFIVLDHAPYSVYVVNKDGSCSDKLFMTLDGKNGAKYTYYVNEEENVIEGQIEKTENKTKEGFVIYKFTSISKTFNYLLILTDEAGYVYPLYDEVMGNYSSNDGLLYFDGYLNTVSYTNTEGETITGSYVIESENLVKASFDGLTRYFDIDGKSFTIKGIEYGKYTVMENQGANSLYIDLDGYLKATVYTKDNDEIVTIIDDKATYEIIDDKYVVYYKNEQTEVILNGYLLQYYNTNGIVDVFFIEDNESVHTYINNKDWSVLKLSSKGTAVRVDNKGAKDEGTYTIITDNILYYESYDGTYANIYKYNKEKSSITEAKYTPTGYYTENLKSLLFTQYGFAVFNFDTKYYYDKVDNNIIIYTLDPTNKDANEYGYVSENFGEFTSTKEYKDDIYYQNDGFAITFNRKEETKDYYPALISNNPEPLYSTVTKFTFSPTGSDTFSSSGTIYFEIGASYSCTVNREYIKDHYEMYIQVGYYRFDIVTKYLGQDEQGNSNSTFEITGMSNYRHVDAYQYLNNYYMYYYFYGQDYVSTYENNIGVIELKQVFDEDAKDPVDDYVIITFKDETKAVDLNGNLLNTLNSSYEYDSTTGLYTVEITGTDGYTYKIYFLLQVHQAFNTYGYILYAVTREETIESGDYTLIVERIITTDYSVNPGAYYSIKMKKNGTDLNSTESFTLNDTLHFVERTFDEDSKLTSTTYYKLEFSLKEMTVSEDMVVPYDSFTVTIIDTTTYQTEDNKSYFDIIDSKIIFININGSKYLVSESSYNEETKEYTIVLPNLTEYTITIDNDIATITEVIEEEVDNPEEIE